jgi:hypothetical protein
MLIPSRGFNFYYNSDKSQKFRLGPLDHWDVEYPKTKRPIADFVSECVNAANELSAFKKPLLLFSGGIDSEVMVRSFHEAKVGVDVCIADYQGLNQHDIEYAFTCCEELKITPIVLNINLEEFWQTELDMFAAQSQTFSPQLCTYMKISSYFPNHLILIGGGENHLVKENNSWYLSEKERISGLHRYFLNSNISGWGGFFQYTPELIRSSLLSMLSYTTDEFIDSKDFKFKFYKQHWDIKERPKYTGFEKVQDLDFVHRSRLKQFSIYGDSKVLTNIGEFFNE